MIVFLPEYTLGVLSSDFINKIFCYLKKEKEKRSAINMIRVFLLALSADGRFNGKA